jgi:enamine deaminase RidA (YjgF/YER057c/UK114 family)
MRTNAIQAKDAPSGQGYAQALKLRDFDELLFISGQIPETTEGDVPSDFDDQCRIVWHNIEAQLRAADMSLDNLVKITTFLSHPIQREPQSRIRQEILGNRQIALTVIICNIYSSRWLLEIEAIAAR